MGSRARFQERRRQGRPQNGDVKPCPHCDGTCEFNERYRFADSGTVPAWLCDASGCGFRQMVRGNRAARGRRLVREAREVQAHAKRQMMRGRARTTRSKDQIGRSAAQIKKSASRLRKTGARSRAKKKS
jgi:hypothetical protein